MDTRKPVILVIDDEDSIRDYVRFSLEDEYTVLEANDGLKGLRLMEQQDVDVVVTDLVMPGKEGIETILALRKSGKRPGVVAMSGVGNRELYLKVAKGIGADATLGKPFSREDLVAAVSKALTRPQLTQA